MLNELIRMCLISSVFAPIQIEGREIPMRSQINLCIEAPFGTGKTYILESIRQRELGFVMDRWTENAFYGTINRVGQVIPPATLLAKGKTVLIDEFQTVPWKFKVPLLKLLEEQVVNRELLNKVAEPVEREGKYYYIKAIEGYLVFHIRASYLIMTSRIGASEVEKMLMSRCITIRLDFQLEDVYTGLGKLDLDDIEELREKLDEYEGSYTEEQDKQFLDTVVQELVQANIPFNYAYRVRDNLIRIDNYIKAMNSIGIELPYKAEDFLPLLIAGIKGVRFRPVELEIYAKLPSIDKDEKEFAELLQQKGVARCVNGKFIRCCNFVGGGKVDL